MTKCRYIDFAMHLDKHLQFEMDGAVLAFMSLNKFIIKYIHTYYVPWMLVLFYMILIKVQIVWLIEK